MAEGGNETLRFSSRSTKGVFNSLEVLLTLANKKRYSQFYAAQAAEFVIFENQRSALSRQHSAKTDLKLGEK